MALQHLRSSTANKRPVPGNMSDGQLGINTNTGSPGLFFKDSNNTLVKVGPVHVGTTAPNASPASGGTAGNSVGEQWLDTSGGTYVFKIWDGGAWRSEAGEFVNTTGDTMTGALGIIAGSASTPGLFFSGDANTGLYSPGADQVAISTNGTGRLFVDASGNVGVGVSPSAIFEAAGSEPVFGLNHHVTQYLTSTKAYNATPGGGIALRCKYNSANDYTYGAGISFEKDNAADGDFGSHITLQTRPNAGSATERLRITSAGLVGIGTSSPDWPLHINAGSSGAAYLGTSGNGNTARFLFGQDATGLARIFQQAANPITFWTNDLERARIDSSGRLLVGTSTGSVSSSSFGTAIGTVLAHSRDTSTGAVAQLYGSAGEFRIIGSGNAQNTNNSYGAISDQSLKTDIADAGSQWDDIKGITVRKFKLIGTDNLQIGVVAQECELVSPGLVEDTVLEQEDGTTSTVKAVKYSVLYMKAVKALQEAMERIEQLEQRLAAAGI